MTVTYDLTTLIGQVRLKIADTSLVTPHFTDEELQVFITEAGDDVLLAAALALEAWAAYFSESTDSERLGDYSYTKKQAANKLALAARYRESSGNAPAVGWAEMDLTSTPDSCEEGE